MQARGVELRRVALPLRAPFRTSFGSTAVKEAVIVRLVTDVGEGWGESAAMAAPVYSAEYAAGVVDVLRSHLVPALFAAARLHAAGVADALSATRGHMMAKGALEMAVLDAELRAVGRSWGEHLGATRTRVPAGVSVGIAESTPALLEEVAGFLEQGYVRIKIKVGPGWDVKPVRAIRQAFGDDLLLQVDANAAYRRTDIPALRALDDFGLLLLEQPLEEDDLLGHAELARRLQTPVCLDETITSARRAADAIALGACSVVNIKPGRVGGYLEARRIHDLCQASGVAAWCGGMLETGIGRAANIAFAALPGCVLPGDVSASDRYFDADLTEPWVLDGGHIDLPRGPGLGVVPDEQALAELTLTQEWIACPG